MRITRLNIDNFGPFSKRLIDPVDDALTVVHGPNEAGKSALRAFMRSTMFGYLDKRRSGFDFYNYPPANGGVASGTIDLVTASGESYSVHREQGRNGGPVIVSGDASGGAELLEHLLDRIGPDLYQNLFSISLSELQEFSTLNSPEIRDRIYSVGLGLSRVSLPDAMAQLERDIRALRGPKSGSVRKAEKDLHEARAELEEARKDHTRYSEVTSQLASIEYRIKEKTDELEEARTQRERQKLIISLRPHWDRKRVLEEQIASLPQFEDFLGNPEQQLDDLLLQENMLKEQVQRGDHLQDQRTEEIKNVPVIEKFEDNAAAVRRLTSETEHYRKAVEDLPGVQTDLRVEEEKFNRDLELLGSGWSEQRIATFDAPVDLMANLHSTAQQVIETREAYRESESEVRRRTDDHAGIAEEVSRATANRDAIQGVPEQSSEHLDKQQERLGRLRGALAERFGVNGQAREAELKLADSLKETESTIIGGFFGSIWLPVAMIILSIAAIIYSVYSRELSGALPGLLGITAGVIVMVRARTSGHGFKINIKRVNLKDARSILTEQRNEYKSRLEELDEEIKTISGEFGMKDEVSVRDIEEQAVTIERAMNRRLMYENRNSAVAEAKERLKSADARLQEASDNRTIAYNNYATAYASWQNVLKQAQLRDDLEPEQAISVMERIRSLKSQLRIVQSYRDRSRLMTEAIGDIEARLAEALDMADMAPAEHMQSTPSLMALAERFRTHELGVQRRETLIHELNTWIKQRDVLERRISQVEGQVAALMRPAGTQDEQEFRQIARMMVQRWNTEQKLAELEEHYPLLSSRDGAGYREELERHSPDELNARLARLEDEAREIEAELAAMQRDRGDLERQRKHIEASSRTVELRGKINMLEERLSRDADRWAVLRIASHLLERTRETFQRERQPSLILAAGKYFKQLTLGRYDHVEAVVGEQDLVVYESGGARKGVSELSRGTAEQLYLSMRFALIEEYSRNAEPMPVIMDDVLVNFDPDRARAACNVIADLSGRFQVLVLTCHPQTVAYFREACAAQGRRKARPLRVVDLQEDSEAGQLTLVG